MQPTPSDMAVTRSDFDASSKADAATLREALRKKQESLNKLWDAYEAQEREVVKLKEKLAHADGERLESESALTNLKMALEARDTRIREMDIELIRLRKFKEEAEPKVHSLEAQLRAAEDRYSKVFKLAEVVSEKAKYWQRGAEERDTWFDRHIGVFGEFKRALEERETMMSRLRAEASGLETQETLRRQSLKSAHPGASSEPAKKTP